MSMAPGTKLGPYEILARVGSGGMGVVYRARDSRLERQVAIKVLPTDTTRDEIAKQRFLHEARTASALDHVNICTIHEVNETPDGQLYLVMALLRRPNAGASHRARGRSSAGSPRYRDAGRPAVSPKRTALQSCIVTSSRPTC